MAHDNVVRFFGIAFIGEEQFIVTEFINKGSVISFLTGKTKKDVSPLEIVKMCRDAAAGMAYLHEQGIVHRDLAARNLLITERAERDYVVKVTDFGLSRKVSQGKYYQKSGKTGDPVKWAAPESFKPIQKNDIFKGRVSERSDRWSFGIVLWELFTLCALTPYPDHNNGQVKGLLCDREDMWKYLVLEDAPDGVFDILKHCLAYESEKRPPFSEMAKQLAQIVDNLAADGGKLNAWKFIEEAKPAPKDSGIPVDNPYGDPDDAPKEVDTYEQHGNEEE